MLLAVQRSTSFCTSHTTSSRPACEQHVRASLGRCTARLYQLAPAIMSNDAPLPISDAEVIKLAKGAFEHSRSDLRAAAESAPRELQQQQPGITIDLGHKNISRLPDEVIDVIMAEIEREAVLCPHRLRLPPRTRLTDTPRLALSHNLLASLPSRLIECKRLRYLNVRYNAMREFPEAVRVPLHLGSAGPTC